MTSRAFFLRRLHWRLAAALLVSAMLVVTGCSSLDNWQRKAIFQHQSTERFVALPAPPSTEEFDLQLHGGDHVHMWYLPLAGADDAPTVLYLHGARRNLNGSVNRIERLHALGFNVLALDYRGFGKSTPLLPSEASALEDTQAAFAELARRQPDAARRFVYGYSLGGALAIALAAGSDGMAGLMVESSFTSIADLVRDTRLGWMPLLDVAVTQDFDSIGRIARVTEPLLLIHGTADRLIPHRMSDLLFSAAQAVPADLRRIIKIDGASHRGALIMGGAAVDAAVRDFVAAATSHALTDATTAAVP